LLAKKSIRTGLLVILVAIILSSIIIYTYIGISSTADLGIAIQQTATDALRHQAETFLVQLTAVAAQKNNNVLESVRHDAGEVAAYAQNTFEHPEVFATPFYWKFDEHVFMGKGGQHMSSPTDTSSVFIPNYVNISDVKQEVELSAYLDSIFQTILENNSSSMAVYFIGLQGEIRYYPNIGLGNVLSPGERLQEGIFFSVADSKNNPERKVVWTPVYDDLAGQGPMITASAPIYTKQKGFMGVLGIDVTLNAIIRNIEEYNPVEHSYSFLIDKDGYSIALPEEGYQEILGREQGANESRVNLNNVSNEFGPVIKKMKEGSTGSQEITIGNEELYVAYAPLESTGFSLGIVAEKAIVLKAVSDIDKEIKDSTRNMIYHRILPAGLLILIVSFAIGFFLINRMIKPVKNLTDIVERASKGDFNTKIEIKSTDEIGRLAFAFNHMVKELKESHDKLVAHQIELEETVSNRTNDLNKKVKELTDTKTAVLNILEDVNLSKDDLEKSRVDLLKLNKDMEKANVELKKSEEYKNQFISITAHELKTPLASIHGFAGLLQNKKILANPKQRNYYLGIIQEDSERLKKLIDDILDLSRLDLGTMKFYFEKVDIKEISKELVKEMYVLAAKNKLALNASVAANVPEIISDKSRLIQVLVNLVSNAIKYTPKRGGKIHVYVVKKGNMVQFSVKDTGIGIPRSAYHKLFQRFFQVDSWLTRKVGGSGLGLSISRGIVEALGGKIWFESKINKGTTFFFTLPVKIKAKLEEKEIEVFKIKEKPAVEAKAPKIPENIIYKTKP
jgi:two-component system phosphate regulon sensor histidine kinase PhoR